MCICGGDGTIYEAFGSGQTNYNFYIAREFKSMIHYCESDWILLTSKALTRRPAYTGMQHVLVLWSIGGYYMLD